MDNEKLIEHARNQVKSARMAFNWASTTAGWCDRTVILIGHVCPESASAKDADTAAREAMHAASASLGVALDFLESLGASELP